MSTISHAEAHVNDGDQKQHDEPGAAPYEAGKEHSHNVLDSVDQRSIANRLAAAEHEKKLEKKEEQEDSLRPTEIAKQHGNEPSRGAKIDQQIEDEEQAELERKGRA
ncbi:hypothetical protein MNV49_006816 [Pseudohyphozyma bogoriensis]|nr:hypothetical protein MNV49_006816 [Pseudohyphozyma bogoriensis]